MSIYYLEEKLRLLGINLMVMVSKKINRKELEKSVGTALLRILTLAIAQTIVIR